MDSSASCLTRVPKGVYRYASHDDMVRDWERWQTAAMVEAVRARG